MSWLLALHSSSPVLGVGLLDLARPDQPPRLEAFDLGRGLSNQLIACLETVLPAPRWGELARLAVGGLEPNELAGFQQRSADVMGRLMERGY